MNMERFPIDATFEVRAAGGKTEIRGYAAVFEQLSGDLGGFREKIAPGAFAGGLGADIRALWNHNPDHVLGRSSAGTLRLREDAKGLRVEIDPPASAAAFVESVQRGDVSQMSIGFRVVKDTWEQRAGETVRTLLDVELVEVSPVTFPAYPQTSIGMRSLYGEVPSIPESIRRAPVENKAAAGVRAHPAGGAASKTIETRSGTMNVIEMRRVAAAKLEEAQRLDGLANAEQRLMTEEERGQYDSAVSESRRLQEAAQRAEELEAASAVPASDGLGEKGAPNILRHYKRGDNEARAVCAYLRRGDVGALMQLRASNNTDMNIGTPADGGYAVPTGLYNGIIAKRDEVMLAPKLGVRKIAGKGLTVNVPIDNGTANVFVATNEATAFDRDAPVLDQVAMTLVKYSKKAEISDELLADEDANILAFLEDYIGRALGRTHNSLLCAAALAGGTSVTYATKVATAGHVQQMVYALKGEYTEGAAWVMPRSNQGGLQSLAGSAFLYMPTPGGSAQTLWGYPIFNSEYVPVYAANAKTNLFGNFQFVGLRDPAGLEMLRDPYTGNGQLFLKYYFRAGYAVLGAEAIQYGTCSA